MMSGWKIVVSIAYPDGRPPVKEYYIVAIADREQAIAELRDRERLTDAHTAIAGHAGPDWLEWLDVRPGEILFISSRA